MRNVYINTMNNGIVELICRTALAATLVEIILTVFHLLIANG